MHTEVRTRGWINRAMTLVELLVVISVIGFLMAIVFGALFTSPGITRARATETLVADLIRQARQTAISTGAPVELRIEPDQERWVVKGVNHVPVFAETFEGMEPRRLTGLYPGLSGQAWLLGWPNLTPAGDASRHGRISADMTIPKSQGLMRKRGDGFYLSCQFRPPLVTACAGVDLGNQVAGLPLIILTEDAGAGGGGPGGGTSAADAFAALTLVRKTRKIQEEQGFSSEMHWWSVTAWVKGVCFEDVRDGSNLHPSTGTPPQKDVLDPWVGESWAQVGLLYSSAGVFLYRDGVATSVKQMDPTDPEAPKPPMPVLDPPTSSMKVIIGESVGALGAGVIDDVRIYRLGADRPVPLPSGVRPEKRQPMAWLMQPDGTVNPTNRYIFETDDPSTPTIIITIDNSGRVTSRLTNEPIP